jgi:hypothetical protein
MFIIKAPPQQNFLLGRSFRMVPLFATFSTSQDIHFCSRLSPSTFPGPLVASARGQDTPVVLRDNLPGAPSPLCFTILSWATCAFLPGHVHLQKVENRFMDAHVQFSTVPALLRLVMFAS